MRVARFSQIDGYRSAVVNCQSALAWLTFQIVLPSRNFVDEGLFAGNAAIEVLGGKDAELGFRHISTAVLSAKAITSNDVVPPAQGTQGQEPRRARSLDTVFVDIAPDKPTKSTSPPTIPSPNGASVASRYLRTAPPHRSASDLSRRLRPSFQPRLTFALGGRMPVSPSYRQAGPRRLRLICAEPGQFISIFMA
jgi:hypothetical protein